MQKFQALNDKTGNKKCATCFATLLKNELNSDVALNSRTLPSPLIIIRAETCTIYCPWSGKVGK